ncbi:MAG TPA: hypothetical protein VI011_13320 [Asanoa sp.]
MARFPRAGTLGRDLALAGIALAGGVLLLALGAYRQINPMPWSTPPWAYYLPLVAVCAAVALRRVAPRRSLALGTAALAADLLLGGSLGTILIYTQVVYDAWCSGRRRCGGTRCRSRSWWWSRARSPASLSWARPGGWSSASRPCSC